MVIRKGFFIYLQRYQTFNHYLFYRMIANAYSYLKGIYHIN